MPSQQQLRWSQLRVGITVIVASITLSVLVVLMSGTSGGLFARKLTLRSYFANTAGLRVGAPVSLQGVEIGSVKDIRIDPTRKVNPVEVIFRVGTQYQSALHKDTLADLSSAGVLGELFVDLDSKNAKLPPAQNGDELPSEDHPDINDMIKSGQGTLQNMDVLVKRLDGIVAGIENGQGSIGKVLKDPALFDHANQILNQMQRMMDQINNGKGSVGKLLYDDELYRKIDGSVDKVNKMVDDLNAGHGTAGKLLKDEQLYRNANETIAKANRMMDEINHGQGTVGKLVADKAFAAKVDKMVTNLAALSDKMNSNQGSVGKLFGDPSLYNNADRMLVETRSLVKAIRENPKTYLTIHFKVF